MARSRSASRERVRDRVRDKERKRDRSDSPREKDSRKRSRASPARESSKRRSKSPTRDRRRDRDARSRSPARRKGKDGKVARSRSRSPIRRRDREAGERSRSPRKRDDSERSRPKENGKEREASRGKSPGRPQDREKDRDRGHDKARTDKDRASSRGRGRDEERRDADKERRDGDRERRDGDRERRDGDRERRYGDKDVAKEGRENGTSKAPEEGELTEIAAEEAAPGKKAEPLSLEEFLKRKKKEEEEAAKPKFLSKKQREELALQRRQEQADTQKQKVDDMRKEHNPYQSVADREREAKKREADRRLEQDRQRYKEERERQKELELIKQQYLGGEKVKKKIRKPSEKFHLNFDWEASDDTSRDLNPIYNSTHEAAILFGSGKRAGVDVLEQKKMAAEHQRQLLKKMREAQGLKETKLDRERDRERRRVAESFDDFDNKKAVAHWSDKAREDMTERDWRIFREDFNISYKGVNVSGTAMPVRNWAEANLPAPLMKAIDELGYKKPSPIQMASIPLGLMQRDVIGVAETGSGKTAAFVLPMLCYLMKQPEMTEEVAVDGPYSIVMAPVRELAQQIEEETNKLAKFTNFRTVSVVGGQDINDQAFKLRKGCEIVIATPGRLKDCVEQSYAVLNQCNYVVLDEADRMIDMGFEPQVVGVLDAMPSSNLKPEDEDGVLEEDRVYRTTYMFSATMPPTVERLARKYMRRPVVINIGSAGKATENVTQKVYMVKENEKLNLMERELEEVEDSRAIVFANTKRSCDVIAKHLDHLGYRCTMLHGGKAQDQREASLQGFREEKYNVLVATNVAGRGIDVPDVALVVNYDMPNTIGEYTHRIGRTARAGRKGVAITFLTLNDTEVFYDLKKLLEDSNAAVPPQLAHHEAAKQKQLPGDKPRREQTIYAK